MRIRIKCPICNLNVTDVDDTKIVKNQMYHNNCHKQKVILDIAEKDPLCPVCNILVDSPDTDTPILDNRFLHDICYATYLLEVIRSNKESSDNVIPKKYI